MDAELPRLCKLDASNIEENRLILIREGVCHDSTFAFAELCRFYLNHDGNAMIVSLRQAQNHYRNVLTKFNVKVDKFEKSGRYEFFDGMKVFYEFFLDKKQERAGALYLPFAKSLYEAVAHQWGKMKNQYPGPSILVIDDIITLESIGMPERLVQDVVSYFKKLTLSGTGSLLIIAHSEQKDKSLCNITTELAHSADIILDVDKLSTGYCSEIDGELICKRQDISAVSSPSTEKMHYHILSSGQVKYIAPGLSAAVL